MGGPCRGIREGERIGQGEPVSIVTVYATFPTPAEAERIALAMVEQGHAACANILQPCLSLYRWEGELHREQEIPALFKTSAAKARTLIEAIAALHSHDVPAITAWPVSESLPAYAQWVNGGR